ncbi:MAG: Planctomycete cytochrome [Schlesneria sp.]|nr:Planctomycete cytochrome [Schlesneria sp.]
MQRTVVWLFSICLLVTAKSLVAAETSDAAFFETKVRPLLIAKCQECHAGDKAKAGLRLDSREAVLAGGESGTAAIAGKPDESLLIEVIGYRNALQMPPKAKLPDAEIAVLTEWVRRGIPWPNSKSTVAAPAAKMAATDFTEEQKSFWAFQKVRRDLPPPVKNEAWIRSPIDQYILADLEAQGLTPAREADRRTLIRRVTLDLTGLPPTPDEVADFTSETAVDALERLIDRLLASPRYGERWARHWLDVARYADSNGLDENLAYATAFRFRDYVVKAFREDKPYDRFLIEQIAGDLLPAESTQQGLNPSAEAFDGLIATGFLCLGAKMLAEDDPVKMQMDIIDEQVDTVARAVMGLTMGCARCHDHKFDPITAEDYYGLAGIFKSTQTMDTFTVVARWHERPLATTQQLQQRDERQQLASTQKQVVEQLKADATEAILSEARRHPGAYLLAATREFQLAEQLKGAKPRGNEPNLRELVGVILIEAEDYARGNVLKERSNYGKDIGVLVNRGEAPNFTEYDLDLEKATTY